jgi:group II intron reverse transcriptase/maturase
MNVSTKQQRIAELAQRHAGEGLTTLHHHLDLDWLRVAYERVRKDGAPGIDGVTWASYGEQLEANLEDLLKRVKTGCYRAPPVRRVHIPKGNGKETRPIGIPTLEDKVLQRAVVMLLEPILEGEFHGHSFGFRPGRSAHQALAAIWESCTQLGIRWIVDADIRKYFDTIDHGKLREMLRRRVQDGVILRLLGKWLKAGVLEEGVWWRPEAGSPQGGVISPLLSNLYLHEVLDEWLVRIVPAHLKGRWFIVRFADDYVLGFQRRDDAERVLAVLPKRFARYGLTLHPEKTRLVAFGRPSGRDGSRPDTFDFLGFTHYWGRSRRGGWVIKRKTAKDRFNRGLKQLAAWCRRYRHRPIRDQHATLWRKLRGHYAFYGITGNARALQRYRTAAARIWWKWLNRRDRGRKLVWERFTVLLRDIIPLPPVRIVHSVYSANP